MTELVSMPIQIPYELLVRAVADAGVIDRHHAMVTRLGEACSKTAAAHEINCTVRTITTMIADGRLKSACEGTRVDVRSLADYIERRPQVNREARLRKKYGTTLRV